MVSPIHLPRSSTLARTLEVAFVVTLVSSCTFPREDARLSGRALDADTLLPLSNVTIEIRHKQVVTNQRGDYSLTLPPGVHKARVSHADTSVTRFIGIWDTRIYHSQEQDLLIPHSATEGEVWLVNFGRTALFDSDGEVSESGLLIADQYGNGGHFIETGRPMAQLARWDAVHHRVYFSEDFGFFRHDIDDARTTPVACAGLPVDLGPDMICLDSTGDSALVGDGDDTFALRRLDGACSATRLEGLTTASPRMCSFSPDGRAFVSVEADVHPGIAPSRLSVVDFNAAELRVVLVDSVADWDTKWPVATFDDAVLVERYGRSTSDTWRIPLNGDPPIRLSDTVAPIDLVDNRLYFDRDGLHVVDLDTKRNAMLFNATWAADRMNRWQ